MKKYVVHVTNPTSLDERVHVTANEWELAGVAQQAIEQILSDEGGIDLPIFIDIHHAEHAPAFEPLHACVAM